MQHNSGDFLQQAILGDRLHRGNGKIMPVSLTTLEYFCKNHGDQRVFFNLKSIINVLVSSFCGICISMLWVYGHYILFIYFSAGTKNEMNRALGHLCAHIG